ncbi:MAG: outer membrane protein assembly factor BamE [Pseudomonadota bacterium]
MQNRILIAGLIAVMLSLVACDQQRISELEDGVATEGDVRLKFGEPEKVWDGPNGARIFEYSRQPEGHVNYMITIGADGKMSALRQVLTPANFAKVTPGMMMEDVRKLLGKPMKITPFELKREIAYDWRYLEDGNKSMIFTVYFNPDYRVLRTGAMGDRNSTENRNAP